jgi:lactaldehyde dehydrogenase / glycolaldehyde dehydrogenase
MITYSHTGNAPRGQERQRITVNNPATGRAIAEVELASNEETLAAAARAAAPQPAWQRLPQIERAEALRRLAQMLLDHAGQIAAVLALESGKSPDDARAEVTYAAEITRYHAEWARRLEGEVIPSDAPDELLVLQREPIGVVVCLIPFNYPIYTLFRKLAPALIAGNTVVARPSNHTPCSALEIARLLEKAGLPADVLSIMAMDNDAARLLCTHPRVGMISLTGSVAAGRHVLEYCKENIAKPSLELGGKTPVLVAPDADIALAARVIAGAKRTHCGQVCTSPERVYAADPVHDSLLAALREALGAVRFGDRAEHPDRMGPLVTRQAQLRTHAAVQAALAAGAKLETGGYLPEGDGYFYPATLLSNCRHDMAIMQEELFAPVLAVMRVPDLDSALACANDHPLGLTSMLFTENYRDAMRIATQIQAGELIVNRAPADPYQGFHAGWKQSGLGGDDGKHGVLAFTQTRLVTFKF